MDQLENRLQDRSVNDLDHGELLEVMTHQFSIQYDQLAIIVLMRPIELREELDLQILQRFTSRIEFFANISNEQGPDLHLNLCKNLQHEFGEKDHVLFEEGSIGTNFYVILTGSVSVYIRVAKTDGSNEFESKKVGDIQAGKSFGELAIMDDVLKPRKATIVCNENSHFATLSRSAYQANLGHIQKELRAQIDFLTRNPLFAKSKWSNRALEQWLKLFQMQVYPRNTCIYREGDPCDDLYFVRSGDLICTKLVEYAEPVDLKKDIILDEKNQAFQVGNQKYKKILEVAVYQETSIFGEEESLIGFQHEKNIEKDREKMKRELKDKIDRERIKEREMGKRAHLDMTIPSEPDEDGELIERFVEAKIEFLSRQTIKRETSVYVTSAKAEIWTIAKKNFFAQMEGNQTAWKHLESMLDQKRKWRQERIKEFQQYASNHMAWVAGQPVALKDRDIESIIKKKRYARTEIKTNVIYKEDPTYHGVLKNLKALKEAKQMQGDSMDRKVEHNFPLYEMRQKSSLTMQDEVAYNPLAKRGSSMSKNPSEAEHSSQPNNMATILAAMGIPSAQGVPGGIQGPDRRAGIVLDAAQIVKNVMQKGNTTDSESNTLYGSFFGQMEDTNFNKFLSKKSKLYKGRNDKLKKNTAPNHLKKEVLIVENPIKGLNYTSSLAYNQKRQVELAYQKGYRISSHVKVTDVMDCGVFINERMADKKALVDKMINLSPVKGEMNEPFFNAQEIKESEDNFNHEYFNLSRGADLEEMKQLKKSLKMLLSTTPSPRLRQIPSRGISPPKKTEDITTQSQAYDPFVHPRIHELHSRSSNRNLLSEDQQSRLNHTQEEFARVSPHKFYTQNDDIQTITTSITTQPIRSQTPNLRGLGRFARNRDKSTKSRTTGLKSTTIEDSTQKTKEAFYPEKSMRLSQNQAAKLIEEEADPSNEVLKIISDNSKIIQINHQVASFKPHHRVLSTGSSNVFNRKALTEKVWLLSGKNSNSPAINEMMRRQANARKAKKNLFIEGKKEILSELKSQQMQTFKGKMQFQI